MITMMETYRNELALKYQRLIENRWFWVFFGLLILVSVIAYAFYCTARGYNFSGNIKLHWPHFWEMGVGCKR
ncbi:membrane protein [Oenococcus kitaharae]|nr:membrane protein [Oenococcus kitaharae]OEY84111.1 membrane protein [Oenococcus kitaharae]OEY85529.1 membrane protein [Oenococcus kitaharae]